MVVSWSSRSGHPAGAVLVVASVLLAGVVASTTWGSPVTPSANLIVGFTGPFVDEVAIAQAGGTLVVSHPALGIAGVQAADPGAFARSILGSGRVSWVETNDGVTGATMSPDGLEGDTLLAQSTAPSATQWDATQWDATQWDATTGEATQWDATQWDATQWDATLWDATQWDATQWDATQWDATQWDATRWASMTSAGLGGDATQWDATQWDATQWDATQWDSARRSGQMWDSAWLTSLARSNGIDPLKAYQWGFQAVQAPDAQAIYAGSRGATVCIIDSGIDYYHPDIARNLRTTAETGTPGWNFVAGNADPADDAGHGTAVAGIISGVLSNRHGVAGLARERIIVAKVLDAHGSGSELNLALAIDFCARNGADVVSMSLSTDQNSPAVARAVADAAARDVALVAAAGNVGLCPTCIRYPAAYPNVISVGATLPSGKIAPYSAVGPKVSLVAPGWGIVTTTPGGSYAALNGTSFAAPAVSATMALLLEKNPSLTAAKAGSVVAKSARDLGAPGRDPYYGHGALDMEAAIRAANMGA